jgi:hypothetical protein
VGQGLNLYLLHLQIALKVSRYLCCTLTVGVFIIKYHVLEFWNLVDT